MTQSRGIETVLMLAAQDADFRAELAGDRLSAIDARGLSLTPAEREILVALSDSELDEMIGTLAAQPPLATRDYERVVCGGIRPDQVIPAGIQPAPGPQGPQVSPGPIGPAGIRPDHPAPVLGTRPGPVKGIRPGRVLLAAAATTAIAGSGYFGVKALTGSSASAPADAGEDQEQDEADESDGGLD